MVTRASLQTFNYCIQERNNDIPKNLLTYGLIGDTSRLLSLFLLSPAFGAAYGQGSYATTESCFDLADEPVGAQRASGAGV